MKVNTISKTELRFSRVRRHKGITLVLCATEVDFPLSSSQIKVNTISKTDIRFSRVRRHKDHEFESELAL